MIITSTPLRISLGGGGTDAPSFYRREPGFVVSAAIDRHVYLAVNRTFTDDYLLKYSTMERVDRPDQVQHRIMRAALELLDIPPGVEVASLADIPSGTGLGSSGSFTVGLLHALHAHVHQRVEPSALAEMACHIEIDLLGEPVGKQDQYIAAHGGITAFAFRPDGQVEVQRLPLSEATRHALDDRLLLFFTGYSRAAGSVLEDQHRRSNDGDQAMLANLTETLEIGRRSAKALTDGDLGEYGRLLHHHWEVKRARTTGMSNEAIDRWYELGRANGAVGGKLVGAGAGGFLLFLAEDPARLRSALEGEGLDEVRFRFDQDGSRVIVRT